MYDKKRAILDHIRVYSPTTVVIFASSLAVYGPPTSSAPITESTRPSPQSSYGAQKLMVETYISDFSRRGLVDGRVARLPTVVVRPGAPSAAASSFASGIVREPLQGKESVLPIADKALEMWVCSPRTVVENLVRLKDVPRSKFGGESGRTVNLPGITITVQ